MTATFAYAPSERPAAAPASEIGVLELVLAEMRARIRRRTAWLQNLWGDEPGTADRALAAALDERDTPEAEAAWQASAPEARAWNARIAEVAKALEGDAGAPLRRLAELFRLSRGELDLLRACLAPAVDPTLGAACAYLQHHAGRPWMTEGLAARLFGYRTGLWSPGSPVAVWRLVIAGEAAPGEPAPLTCDPRIRDWLGGELGLDGELVGVVSEITAGELLYGEPPAGWPIAETAEVLRRALERRAGVRVRVVGPEGSGRRTFAAALAARFRIPALAVDSDAIADEDWPEIHARVQRLAILAGAALAWHGGSLARPWPGQVAPAPIQILALDAHQEVAPAGELVDHRVDLPAPSLDERRRLWSRHVPESAAWPPEELDNLAARYRLTIGDILAAGRRGPRSAREAAAICRELTRHRLGDLGQLLDTPFGWDDLVISGALREALGDFVFEARDRAAFWETSAARRLFPRGTALVGLLGGPPGTGKTMSAQVVAADLELDLFRVDLATVVSKYIGETAKNLRRIFARAAHMNAVLLFDEADALFAKRTEVKDSHDRYANADTNYLLQLIEEYRGIALLATNKRSNVDPAFIRRIRYVFDFERPDGVKRRRIWRRVLAELAGTGNLEKCPAPDFGGTGNLEKCPAPDFDPDLEKRLAPAVDLLSDGLEMTGAQIKNAALAAIFAARRDRRPLAASHLLRGVERELGKDGRSVGKRLRERLKDA